jgi:hypothetical protein
MWNSVLGTSVPNIQITDFLPAVPHRFFASAGSTVVAAAVGGGYGLLGRVIYPNAGISPLHYSIWFVFAYQIQQIALLLERKFHDFLGVRSYLEKLEQLSEDDLDLSDLVRYHCWKVIQLKNQAVRTIDGVFSNTFNIHPYDAINQDNVEESSFLEMCRYRIWPVFKMAVLEMVSFSIAYRLSIRMGFSLPARTSIPIIVVISSIVRDIILVPVLYSYARLCNTVIDKIGDDGEKMSAYRAKWFRWCLPSLTL